MRLLPRILLAVLATAAVVVAGSLTAGRLQASNPRLTAAVTATASWSAAPGPIIPIAVPAQGSLAVDAVDGRALTLLAASQADVVRPTASVAKTMTALVTLEAHPLLPGQAGPVLTMTAQDVQDYRSIAASGGSFAPVRLGEQLSERDLLLGLMLPSANNLALTAARWVDGSVAAFVARLNARAGQLGMSHTHFADPDGLDPATTSTASDLVRLGVAATAAAALVNVVSTVSATLPDGTVITNLDELLGSDPGWLGIKTGWTPAAGGCLLFAARRILAPGAPPLTIVGTVLGQPPDGRVDAVHPELGAAFAVARAAVEAAFGQFTTVRVGPASVPVRGTISAPWGPTSDLHLSGADRVTVMRRGDTLDVAVGAAAVSPPSAADAPAGTVLVSLGGRPVGTWTLVVDRLLAGPSPWWKLLHG